MGCEYEILFENIICSFSSDFLFLFLSTITNILIGAIGFTSTQIQKNKIGKKKE